MTGYQPRDGVWALLLALLLLRAASTVLGDVEPSPVCCPDGVGLYKPYKSCNDTSPINLNCLEFWQFADTDDEKMNFSVHENQTWMQLVEFKNGVPDLDDDKNYTKIPPEEYCLHKPSSSSRLRAFICFQPDAMGSSSESSFVSQYPEVTGIGCLISGIFLGLTLYIYIFLKELRELQDKALMCMVGSFMMAYLIHSFQVFRAVPYSDESNLVCLILASAEYYTFLSAFFWLNVVSLNIWRHVWFTKCKTRNDVLLSIYCVIGWGIPLVALGITLFAHHTEVFDISPGFGKGYCWFNSREGTWVYFYAPITVLLVLNLLYLGTTGYRLWHQCKKVDCCKMKILRFKCQMLIKLAIIMGFTWNFEVISFLVDDASQPFWMVADFLNIMHGVFVFLLLVIFRHKVRKLLAQSRPCDFQFPKSWAALDDKEEGEAMGPDELELSDEECTAA